MDEREQPPEIAERDSRPQRDLAAARLFRSRVITIFGAIDMKIAGDVVAQMLALNESGSEPIRLVINSPGGHVESADSIHDMMRFVRCPVLVLGTGWVASAGVHIFLGAPRERRFCLPNTRFMIHQPSGGMSGKGSDVEIEATEILKMRDRLNDIIATETGQPVERVRQDTNRNFWMNAAEAQNYGLAGSIVASSDQFAA